MGAYIHKSILQNTISSASTPQDGKVLIAVVLLTRAAITERMEMGVEDSSRNVFLFPLSHALQEIDVYSPQISRYNHV